MPSVWRYLAFVDIRLYTFKFVSSSVWVRFQFVVVRWRTLLFAQYVEDFCACTVFDVCQRTASMQRVRSPYASRTVCLSAVRLQFGTCTVAFVQLNCGHALTFFERMSNVLTYV